MTRMTVSHGCCILYLFPSGRAKSKHTHADIPQRVTREGDHTSDAASHLSMRQIVRHMAHFESFVI